MFAAPRRFASGSCACIASRLQPTGGGGCSKAFSPGWATAQPGENALERLHRAVVEASKQCGRNCLMQIAVPQTWDEFLAGNSQLPCRLVAHPGEKPQSWSTAEANIVAAVGPEGGFTEDELERAIAQNWQPVGLGPRVLRVETAVLALAAVLIVG